MVLRNYFSKIFTTYSASGDGTATRAKAHAHTADNPPTAYAAHTYEMSCKPHENKMSDKRNPVNAATNGK